MSISIEIGTEGVRIGGINRGKILKINTHDIKIGLMDGNVITVQRVDMREPDFDEGDEVDIYKDGKDYFLKRVGDLPAAATKTSRGVRKINKNLFVWLGAFLLGIVGGDRFMRGQTGMGFAKMFLWPFTLGIWFYVDLFIAVVKAYGTAYGRYKDISFDAQGKYTR